MTLRILPFIVAVTVAVPAAAQLPASSPVLRGVPAGEVSALPLPLSLDEALRRGVAQNLAMILEEQHVRGAEGARLAALSQLLPHVSGSVRQSRQVLSTAAFGFSLPDLPRVIGPFDLFDARVSLSTPLFDARAIGGLRSTRATARAGRASLAEIREMVVLAIGNLYLEAQADSARVESARAEVATAETLVVLTEDQRAAGIVAGIDVVRQQVQRQAARARLVAAESALQRRKLMLARAIGLPAGQDFTLTDATRFIAASPVTIENAVAEAASHREDLKAAQARVDAARAAVQAEAAGVLPSLHLDADVGVLGNRSSDVDKTYSVAAVLRVPIFTGGQTRARVHQAEAVLHEREAELADITAGLGYDVRAALLDIEAAAAAAAVADGALALSRQELDQAQDRFRAGVSSTLELVQAQDAVASATEQYITSVYNHAASKAALARATGQLEQTFVELVGGQQQ